METHLGEATTTAALEEKQKLRKGYKRFVMIYFTVVAIIGLNPLAAFAATGAQAFTWLGLSAVTFFLPYALLVAVPGGGIYACCKLTVGAFMLP